MCNNSNFMDFLYTNSRLLISISLVLKILLFTFLFVIAMFLKIKKSQFRFFFLYFSMNRENLEREEISIHHVEIKKEPQNLYEGSELRDVDLDIKNCKEETSYLENQIDKDEQFSNEADHDNAEIEEEKPLKRKKQKKKSMKFLPLVGVQELAENYYDLDLSEEFLSQLFDNFNEFCEYIINGDPNINRSSVVVQNLNDAVNCYRVNLPNSPQDIKGTQDPEDFKYEMDLPSYLEKDEDYNPQKKIVKKRVEKKAGPKSEVCNICNKAFSRKDKLKRHVQIVHEGIKKCTCTLCGEQFFDNDYLMRHIKNIHEKEKDHTCPVCDSRFLMKKELKEHISKMHEEMKPYDCQFCHKSFKKEESWIKHKERVHEGKVKDWQCTICGANFFDKTVLETHIKGVHEKQKLNTEKLPCSICNKEFNTKQHLNRHISSVHEKKKPHLCSLCGSSFADKGDLARHVTSVHSDKEGGHICPICNVEKPSLHYLNVHIRNTHEKIPCDICGKSIGKDRMKRHLRDSHSAPEDKRFKCEVCGKFATNRKSVLVLHMKSHLTKNENIVY